MINLAHTLWPVRDLHELFRSLFRNFLRNVLHGSSWSFSPIYKISFLRCLPVLFHASAAKWHTVDLLQVTKKLAKWFQFKCDPLHFSRGKRPAEESVWVLSRALQPLHFPLYVSSCAEGPAVMTSLCSAEHLQPGRGQRQSVACLCRWHLLPWGSGIISPLFSELPNVNLCVCGFYYMWGCDEWEKQRGEHLHTRISFLSSEKTVRLRWVCDGRYWSLHARLKSEYMNSIMQVCSFYSDVATVLIGGSISITVRILDDGLKHAC